MGTPNIITATLNCSRCSKIRAMEVEAIFGIDNFIHYHIDDRVSWVNRAAPQNGGRPENGNFDVEGYVECSSCGKDFWVIIKIREDFIKAVEICNRPGLIPD